MSLASCSTSVKTAPSLGVFKQNQRDAALSGNGENLAIIVDQQGRATVQVQDLRQGKFLPTRHLNRYQAHGSPSLSWTGRYLAVIIQRNNRREVIIEDRTKGRLHRIQLPINRDPIRVSLSPDARQIAIQSSIQGKWRVEVFDLRQKIDADVVPGREALPSASQ